MGLLLDLLLVFVDFYIESENEGRAFAPLWDEVQGSIEVYDYIFWNVEPKPNFFTVGELEKIRLILFWLGPDQLENGLLVFTLDAGALVVDNHNQLVDLRIITNLSDHLCVVRRVQSILNNVYSNLFEPFWVANQILRKWLVRFLRWDEVKNSIELFHLASLHHQLENIWVMKRTLILLFFELSIELKIYILHGSFGLHYIINFICDFVKLETYIFSSKLSFDNELPVLHVI